MRPNHPLVQSMIGLALAAGLAAGAHAQTVNANECANATVINGTGNFTFSTIGATASANPPAFIGSISMNYDVWARWTAPQTGWLILNTCVGSTQFASVSIYQGSNCAALVPWAVGSWNSACGGDRAAFWVNQGDVYTFRLDDGPGTGQFSLTYGTAFPGDECHNALTISGTGVFPFNNSGATSQYLAADPYQYIQNDVWYRWTAPQAGPTYIQTCGLMPLASAGLMLMADECPAVNQPIVTGINSPGCNGGARVDFVAEAGRSYLIRLGATNGNARLSNGAFEIVQTGGGGGGGETIIVTTVYDDVDFTGAQTFASLPGPDGQVSFREACIAANNTPGPQTIEFNVPQADWYYPVTTFAYATLLNEGGDPFLLTDDGTIVDGASQTANVGDTNPAGPDVGFWSWNPNAGNSPNIIVSGNNCVLKDMQGAGLMGSAAWIDGNNNTVIGCRFVQGLQNNLVIRGDDNLIGGAEPGNGNTIEGLLIENGARRTTAHGNRLVGVIVRLGATDTRIGGPADAERNIIGGAGRFCCEGFPTGEQIALSSAVGTIIENNFIGVEADGSTPIPQTGPTGIDVFASTGTIIRGNIVSACRTMGQNHYAGQVFGTGISIAGACLDTVVQGNTIGADASGQSPIVNLVGIRVRNGQTQAEVPLGTLIGGEAVGEGNLIAFSEQRGIVVASTVTGAQIARNRILNNGGLGIDLGEDGVTPNDPADADTGANNRQNFPVIAAVHAAASGTRFTGALNSTPLREFRIEFFASAACDPSGHGEGDQLVGAMSVTTDAAGQAPFDITFDLSLPIGSVAAATATDIATGDTSEFSACRAVEQASTCAADFDGNGTPEVDDIFTFLTAWFAGEPAAYEFGGTPGVPAIFAFLTTWFAGC